MIDHPTYKGLTKEPCPKCKKDAEVHAIPSDSFDEYNPEYVYVAGCSDCNVLVNVMVSHNGDLGVFGGTSTDTPEKAANYWDEFINCIKEV